MSLRLHRSETDLTHTKLEAGLVDTAVGLLVVRAIQIRGKYAPHGHGTRVRALSALRMTVGQSEAQRWETPSSPSLFFLNLKIELK